MYYIITITLTSKASIEHVVLSYCVVVHSYSGNDDLHKPKVAIHESLNYLYTRVPLYHVKQLCTYGNRNELRNLILLWKKRFAQIQKVKIQKYDSDVITMIYSSAPDPNSASRQKDEHQIIPFRICESHTKSNMQSRHLYAIKIHRL